MLWNRIRLASAAALVLITASACDQPRPIPPGTDRFYYGHLVEGEKFGVSVGMSQEEAVRILTERGLRDAGPYGCTYSIAQRSGCGESDLMHLFRQKDFGRDGIVYLKIIDERVDSISWSFAIAIIDF